MDDLSNVLTAISHPTRRAIMMQIAQSPTRFTDLASHFDNALNAITKHIKLLERAGLIIKEKNGREVYISLNAEPLKEVSQWVHTYEEFWNKKLNTFEKQFTHKRSKK